MLRDCHQQSRLDLQICRFPNKVLFQNRPQSGRTHASFRRFQPGRSVGMTVLINNFNWVLVLGD